MHFVSLIHYLPFYKNPSKTSTIGPSCLLIWLITLLWGTMIACNQCLSPLKLWVWIPLRQGVLDITLNDKVCQWLAASLWFSPGTSVSSTNKTDCHDITEILLKVALYTLPTPTPPPHIPLLSTSTLLKYSSHDVKQQPIYSSL